MNPNHFRSTSTGRGFTLVEIAIGMAIISLAAIGLIASIAKQTEQSKIVATRTLIDQANDALLAFAGSAGRLPCPALATTNGQESIASNAGGIIVCSTEAGFLPAATLGLPGSDGNGLLNDAFADGAGQNNGTHLRALRYGIPRLAAPVASALSSAGLGAPGSSSRRIDVQTSMAAGQGLFVCRSSAGIGAGVNRCGTAANTLASNAAAIVWSRGVNGNDIAAWSVDERQNANQPIARTYINRRFDPPGATGGGFDDQLTWLAWPILADRLVRGGFTR